MRKLIKIIILLIVVAVIILSVWGRQLLEGVSLHFLQTDININRARFMPHRLAFSLQGIDLPEKNIFFQAGKLSLASATLKFYGLKFKDSILLGKKSFLLKVSRHKTWEIEILFKGIELNKLWPYFDKGFLKGSINGIYNKDHLSVYGVLNLNDIGFSDLERSFLGISPGEFEEIIEMNKGRLELDFIYDGPIDGIEEMYRYRPGKKTLGLIRNYLLKKILK